MLTDYQVARLFTKPSFVGAMLRYAALLEYDLDCLLTLYFARRDRIDDTLEFLLSELTFGRKIGVLRHLPLKRMKSHATALAGFRGFVRLRNLAAHNWSVPRRKVRELLKDPIIRDVFSDPPSSLEGSFRGTRRALTRLRQSKAFGPQARKASRDMEMRTLLRIMSDGAT